MVGFSSAIRFGPMVDSRLAASWLLNPRSASLLRAATTSSVFLANQWSLRASGG